MSINRRKFLSQSALAAGSLIAGAVLPAEALAAEKEQTLTILHTNDVHSRLEPFPNDGSRNAGLGGVAPRSELIRQVRSETEHVLLLDAGDIFQGTPYFNLYKGEPEIKAMSKMGYDASIMGNHDFDAGIDNFAHQLQHANFPIIMCNYGFENTSMQNRYIPYKVFRKGNLKIGVTGVGIEMKGLVPDNLFGNTQYRDPVQSVNEVADRLKNTEKCDMIICLSHLGDVYNDNKVSDAILAAETYDVDLIIGGHTHRFFEAPRIYKNRRNTEVAVNQVGWAGINLGRLDYRFSGNRKKNLVNAKTVVIGEKKDN